MDKILPNILDIPTVLTNIIITYVIPICYKCKKEETKILECTMCDNIYCNYHYELDLYHLCDDCYTIYYGISSIDYIFETSEIIFNLNLEDYILKGNDIDIEFEIYIKKSRKSYEKKYVKIYSHEYKKIESLNNISGETKFNNRGDSIKLVLKHKGKKLIYYKDLHFDRNINDYKSNRGIYQKYEDNDTLTICKK